MSQTGRIQHKRDGNNHKYVFPTPCSLVTIFQIQLVRIPELVWDERHFMFTEGDQ